LKLQPKTLLPLSYKKNGIDLVNHLVSAPRIIKSRGAVHMEGIIPSDTLDSADKAIFLEKSFHRHKVGDLSGSVFGKKACDQNICIGKIDLFMLDFMELRDNPKISPFFFVEEGGKHR